MLVLCLWLPQGLGMCQVVTTVPKPAGEPFPLNTTVRQTCCLAGTEGYFNGTEPACCPDGGYSRMAGLVWSMAADSAAVHRMKCSQ